MESWYGVLLLRPLLLLMVVMMMVVMVMMMNVIMMVRMLSSLIRIIGVCSLHVRPEPVRTVGPSIHPKPSAKTELGVIAL